MTFAASETGLLTGVPYELHEFRLGTTSTYWRYADGTVADIVYGGNTFRACRCHGSTIERGQTAIKSRTTVEVDWDNPLAWLYIHEPPDGIVHYTRYKGHGTAVARIFTGDVFDVTFKQNDRQGTNRRVEILIDPSSACLRHSGLVGRDTRECPVDVYSAECGVDPDDYETTGVLDAVTGTTLTSSTFATPADGYWAGGKITVNGITRSVRAHSGSDIAIMPMIAGAAAGAAFSIWPGCTHAYACCQDRFANGVNFKGCPSMPDEDPTAVGAIPIAGS